MKKLLLTFLSFFLCFFLTSEVKAVSQFSSVYYITYQIKSDGLTHVKFEIEQTNNLSQIYATDYSLSLSQTQIDNVIATDINTTIIPAVVQTQNLTNISFPFINKVVGKNKVYRFTIEYDTQDIAIQNGDSWEINIPQLEPKQNITQQTIKLIVPSDFPDPAYINPPPNQVNDHTYIFTSHSLANQSISALFGTTQYYRLRLYYNLENTSSSTLQQEIALPPDTGYQKIYITDLSPSPLNITTDQDGNWLAQYQLESRSNLQVSFAAFVKLDFQPQTAITLPQPFHTQSQPVWNFNDDVFIQANLTNLATPKSIYDYVTQSLTYNYHRLDDELTRPGASFALQNPDQVICTEFTDLFIALARQQEIPTREIQGFAISKNDKLRPLSLSRDVLHAWPEYYNSQTETWIQVDPTWTNTTNGIDYFNKLDLNHIAFVIHGQNPDYPLPAGAYKTPQSDSKDIFVDTADSIEFPLSQIQAQIISHSSKNIVLGFKNLTGVSFNSNLSITSDLFKEPLTSSLYLPPFSYQQLSFDLPFSLSNLTTSSSEIIITTDDQTLTLTTDFSLKSSISPVLIPAFLFLTLLIFILYRFLKPHRQ